MDIHTNRQTDDMSYVINRRHIKEFIDAQQDKQFENFYVVDVNDFNIIKLLYDQVELNGKNDILDQHMTSRNLTFRDLKMLNVLFQISYDSHPVEKEIFDQIYYNHGEQMFKFVVHSFIKKMPNVLDNLGDVVIEDYHEKEIAISQINKLLSHEEITDDALRTAVVLNFVTLHNVYSLKNYFEKTSNINNNDKNNIDKIYFKYVWDVYKINNKLFPRSALPPPPPPQSQPIRSTSVSPQQRPPEYASENSIVEPNIQATYENPFGSHTKAFDSYTQKEINQLVIINSKKKILEIVAEMHSVELEDLYSMLEPVYYIYSTSQFVVRKIDILLHLEYELPYRKIYTDGLEDKNGLIRLINKIHQMDPKILKLIFNDKRVTFESHRPFLKGTEFNERGQIIKKNPGATMTSILIEGHMLLYCKIMELVPDIELNVYHDLCIWFNYIISGNVSEIYEQLYIETIQKIKSKSSSTDHNPFTPQLIEELITKLKEKTSYLQEKSWFNNMLEENKLKEFIRQFSSDTQIDTKIRNIFKYHNGWESSRWIYDYNGIFIRIDRNININDANIREVYTKYFYDFGQQDIINGGSMKQTTYKEKYLKYKKKYLDLKNNHA